MSATSLMKQHDLDPQFRRSIAALVRPKQPGAFKFEQGELPVRLRADVAVENPVHFSKLIGLKAS